MKRKIITGLFAVALAGMLIAGCGSSSAKSGSTSQSSGKASGPDINVESIDIIPKSTVVLVGDQIQCSVKAGDWMFYGTDDLTWSIAEGEDCATISENGVVKGIAPGTVTIQANYGDCENTYDIAIVDVDSSTDGTIIVSEDSISLDSFGEKTIMVKLESTDVEAESTVYQPYNMSLGFEWGSSTEDGFPLTIKDLGSAGNKGDITILMYAAGDKTKVIAAQKVSVSVK